MNGLIETQKCHYVAFNGRHLAAFMIGVENEEKGIVDLVVFTNMPNAAGNKNFGMQFHQDVEYSAEPRPGTWHFVEQSTPSRGSVAVVGNIHQSVIVTGNANVL